MESWRWMWKWIHSVLFLLLLIAALHLLHTLTIAPNLTVNHRNARLKKQPDLPLRFRSHDGTFKILQVADVHYGNGKLTRCRDVLETEFHYCTDLNSTSFLRKLIHLENPDLVVFTGDNIFGTSATDAAESMFEVFGPVIESGLPWAAVLGNHDQESTMNREELMSFISLMDYSVSQTFPTVEDIFDPTKQKPMKNIDGFGNYNLRVWGAPGSYLANSSIFNLYFLDSGDRVIVDGVKTYGWIKDSQLSWLSSVSKRFQGKLQNANNLADITFSIMHPAIAFFHIPIPEIRQGPFKGIVGRYNEYIACSTVNSGVLKTLVSMGDVKAVFIGHDHKNDFCGNLQGVWFCYGGGFGYHGYGIAGWPRRARVISAELEKRDNTWMGVGKIKTWKRLDDEMLSKIDEQVLWDRKSSR